MYFYGSNQESLGSIHFGAWGHFFNKVSEDHKSMLHTKFQEDEPSSSAEENLLYIVNPETVI